MEFLSHINFEIWIVLTIALLITAFLIPGLTVSGPISALVTVIVLGFVNAHLWDTALFFSIPDSLSMHTATLVVANGVIFWLIVKLLPGIEVRGLIPALISPVIFALVAMFLNTYAKEVDWIALTKRGIRKVQEIREELKEGEDSSTAAPHKKVSPAPLH